MMRALAFVALFVAPACAQAETKGAALPEQELALLDRAGIAPPPSNAVALASAVVRATDEATRNEQRRLAIEAVVRDLGQTIRSPRYEPPCDLNVAQCRAAAEKIAQIEATRRLARQAERLTTFRAAVFADTMTAAQIDGALSFAGTEDGRTFLAALTKSDVRSLSPALGQKLFNVLLATSASEADLKSRAAMFERFYEQTRNLPRAKMPRPPAPSPVGKP